MCCLFVSKDVKVGERNFETETMPNLLVQKTSQKWLVMAKRTNEASLDTAGPLDKNRIRTFQ